MKVDFHSHTNYSGDGITDVKTYLKMASKNLDAIAITDHNTLKGFEAIKKLKSDFTVIPGIEINTTLGDIIGVFIEEEIKPGDSFEIIDKIKSMGGVSIIPHPFDILRGFDDVPKVIDKVDCIEVFNSRVTFAFENKRALSAAKENNKGISAGSDGHTPKEIGRAYIESKAHDLEELRKHMLSGKVTVHGKISPPTVHLSSTIAKTPLKGILYK